MDDEAKVKIDALERKIDALLARHASVAQAFCVICGQVIDPTEGQSPTSAERIYFFTGALQPRHHYCHR